MGEKSRKVLKLLLLVIAVITISIFYKLNVTDNAIIKLDNIPDYAKDRKVVQIWVRDNYYSNTITEQIQNYNIANKDNIYINEKVYGGDYINMLKMNLLTGDKPDIFDIGTYDVMKTNKLYPLDSMGINRTTTPFNKLLLFKNKSVAVNVSGNVVKFVWNKDIFKKCGLDPDKGPTTWQEVMADSKIIKAKMPEITPFEATFSGYNEFKRSIGEPSVNSDTIHTTFWNYKKGTYDYSSAKYILDFYREMYSADLMPKDLEKTDRNRVRLDFYNGQAAMLISLYDDKIKFLTINPLNFPIGISNLPKINSKDTEHYFFIDDVSRISVNVKAGARPEVKKAFEWYEKTCTDQALVTPYKFKSKFFPEFNGYDNIDNFKFEDKDPTPALSFGYQPIKDLIYSCIRGEESTEVTISNLNKFLNDYCQDIKAKDKTFFNSFIGEE